VNVRYLIYARPLCPHSQNVILDKSWCFYRNPRHLKGQIRSRLTMKKEYRMKEWLNSELEKVEKTYLIKAVNMTGPYQRELGLKKEYDGRQLLELLQNADDEAENARNPAMLMRLEKNRLIVANNGKPFSKGGIRSLIDSDNSPKIMSCRKIGYKGLGFRAVLNWSDSIWIKSGGFSLEFSRIKAVGFFKDLLKKKPELGKEIQEQFGERYKYEEVCPIATLSVPVWKESWEIDTSQYDTYVVINFDSKEILKDIQEQINSLGMEVAIFLNNLKKIVIQSPERIETIERITCRSGDFEEIGILDKDGSILVSKKWMIFSRSGELSEELKDKRKAEQYEFDLRIAVSENMDDDVNRLFSYFKTDVKFPFPAIVHGTFELHDSRNNLVKTPTNKFLLKELGYLMIDTARKLTQADGDVSWNAMKLLTRRGEFDPKIEEMGFYEHMLDAMKTQKLIPVLSKKYLSAQDGPLFYDVPFADVLKRASEIFSNLALYTDDEGVKSLLEELGIETYEKNLFIKKINKASDRLLIQERANLILLVAKNYSAYFKGIKPEDMPNLLIDEQGNVIPSKTRASLPPERAKFTLPGNIAITFISSGLSRILRTTDGMKRASELASKLNCFNVDEYRFDTVIRRVVIATNRLIKSNETKATEYIKNMLSSLIQIYSDEYEPNNQFPSNVNAWLFSRSGSVHSARELYFGKEYSDGRIMEALYAQIDDTIFVTGKEELGLGDKDEKDVVGFLKWMGVEEYPRIFKKELRGNDYESEYDDFVLKNLPYPYETNWNDPYANYEDIKSDKSDQSEIKIEFINELVDILQKAVFEDILAWIHSDQRIQKIIREEHEGPDSSFGIWLTNKHNTRVVSPKDTKSFILWKLKTSEWVNTRSGKKVKPDVCCMSRTISDMSPLVEVPAFDLKHPAFKEYNVKLEDVEYILEKVGAGADFGRLSDETIYSILRELEHADPEGKKAKSIYRHVIQNKTRDWDKVVEQSEVRKKFVEEGKLLAKRHNKVEYLPVNEMYYVEDITFCRQIMERFFIAEIGRRSGNDRVRSIFGVAPLEDIRFILDGFPTVHILNQYFQKDLERFKPYVLAYRVQKHASQSKTFKTEINRLKRLKVVLCTSVRAKYRFGEITEDLALNPFEHIHIPEENTVYLVLEPGKHNEIVDLRNDFDFCDTLSEILSGVLKVEENRSNFRELFPKKKSDRDKAISRDLDDSGLEQLKRAREFFGNISDLELEFWESVLITKGKGDHLQQDNEEIQLFELIANELSLKPDIVKELYENIYYEDYNSGANLPLFKRLFETIGITVQEFNRHSTTQIDFTEHLREEFANEKFRLRNKFKSFAFSVLKDKNVQDKEKFLQINETLDRSLIESQYDINKELLLDIKKCFDILFENDPFRQLALDYENLLKHQDCKPDREFTKNLRNFKKCISETGGGYIQDIETFLDAAKSVSLLYFGEIDELLERFDKAYSRLPGDVGASDGTVRRKKKSISLNGAVVEYEEDDFENISKNVDEDIESSDYEIESHVPFRPQEKAGEGKGYGGRFSGGGGTAKKQTKEIGFLGEKYVYGQLVRKYSKDKVVWASQYARKVNVNPEGRDDIGYDVWYLDENGERHYVEVKASKDDNLGFTISRAEVRFGEQNKSNYEIIRVLNVCDKNRKLRNLGKIFKYEEDESFSNNSKFKVDTDNFRISFQ